MNAHDQSNLAGPSTTYGSTTGAQCLPSSNPFLNPGVGHQMEDSDERGGPHSQFSQLASRPRSDSNVSSTFPSSHDAFGLSASPSASHNNNNSNNNNSYNALRLPTGKPTQSWGHQGSNGYGLYGLGHKATQLAETSSNTPCGNQFAHGVLPTSTLLGDPQYRLSRPSGLSQAWGGEDMEDGNGASMDMAEQTSPQPWSRSQGDVGVRRTQSSFAATPDPTMNYHGDPYTAMQMGAHSSSSRFSLALRRASSDRPHGRDPGDTPMDSSLGSKDFHSMSAQTTGSNGFGYGFNSAPSDMASKDQGDVQGSGRGPAKHPSSSSSHSKKFEGGASQQRKHLPPNLRRTLAAEANLPMQEVRSEALLRRLTLSNPEALPMTPRPLKHNKALNHFDAAASDDSDDEQDDDGNSSEEGTFAVDDLMFGGDDHQHNQHSQQPLGMDVQSSPFAFDPSRPSPGSAAARGAAAPRSLGKSGRKLSSRNGLYGGGLGSSAHFQGSSGEERSGRGSDVSFPSCIVAPTIPSHLFVSTRHLFRTGKQQWS